MVSLKYVLVCDLCVSVCVCVLGASICFLLDVMIILSLTINTG